MTDVVVAVRENKHHPHVSPPSPLLFSVHPRFYVIRAVNGGGVKGILVIVVETIQGEGMINLDNKRSRVGWFSLDYLALPPPLDNRVGFVERESRKHNKNASYVDAHSINVISFNCRIDQYRLSRLSRQSFNFVETLSRIYRTGFRIDTDRQTSPIRPHYLFCLKDSFIFQSSDVSPVGKIFLAVFTLFSFNYSFLLPSFSSLPLTWKKKTRFISPGNRLCMISQKLQEMSQDSPFSQH